MRRPVVGIIGNSHRIENRFPVQAVGERNLRAVAEVSGAIPLMFPSIPEITDVGALLDIVDGIVLTGARANVHPTRFNTDPCEKHEPYDLHRDDVALEMAEACVARGVPLFGICRGLQEMNVAFGGSLLGHAATIRLHVAREDWLPTGLGLPGAAACITVLKHRLAAPDGQACVLIHFEDRGEPI